MFDLSPSHSQPIASSSRVTLDHLHTPSKSPSKSPSKLPHRIHINLQDDILSTPPPPVTPTRRHSSEIDSSLLDDTLSKRMRMAVSNLVATASDPSRYTSKEAMGRKIKELTTSLAQSKQHVDVLQSNQEVYGAQAVVADLALQKMNEAVFAKEEQKKNKPDEIPLCKPGHGNIWTTEKVWDVIRLQKEAKEKEQAEAAAAASKRLENQRKRVEIEMGWKDLVEAHKAAVKEHE
ncbi:hypothetical protein V5O48_008746 [Marasmius crinis-equi]|uniref:Uncharacterized protein n=1 Tax=Marasmius crinis-equi TaxID=585013 RepID=A0ABR3FD90_9AGAR